MSETERHYHHLGRTPAGMLDPQMLLPAIGLQPGETLLDAGAGEGNQALPAARIAGRVYAVDVQPERVATLEARAQEQGLTNVQAIAADLAGPIPLPAASIDRGLMTNVLHELTENGVAEGALREMARLLRPGGVLAIVDFRPELDSRPGPPQAVRVAPGRAAELARPYGFREESRKELGSYHYVLLLRKEG